MTAEEQPRKKVRMKGRYIVEKEDSSGIIEAFKTNDLEKACTECRRIRRSGYISKVWDTKLKKSINIGVAK